MKTYLSFKRLKQHFWLYIANLPMPGHGIRPFFVRLAGVKVQNPSKTFIGKNVRFDGVHPELILIEEGVRITAGSSVLTHFLNPETGRYIDGSVILKKGVFCGINTIITKPVTIGEGAIIGAGSIVTKSIPEYEVWAGNPARFIKKIK